MKLKTSRKNTSADLEKTVATQSVVLVALTVAFVVLAAVVVVLLAQVNGHRISIEGLYNITTGLPTSKQ